MTTTDAPASVTYSLTSPTGYGLLFTVRGESHPELLQEMLTVESSLVDLGYTAQVKSYGGGKAKAPVVYVEGEECPKCGGKLLDKTTKNGKKMHECENRKYDFTTKTTTGCEYVKWLDDDTGTPTATTGVKPASPKQVEILKEKKLYEEGMTMGEASDVLGGVLGK